MQGAFDDKPCMTRQSSDSTATGEALGKWEVQVRKGVLELVILAALRDREQYGFELISGIAKRSALELPEGTLYPLLLRLAKDGLIASRLAEGDGGAPRKYYALTGAGKTMLTGMITRWTALTASVERIVKGAGA